MERRISERKKYQQSLTLESPKTGRVTVIGKNISLGGLLIETGSVSLTPNSLVFAMFELPRSDGHETFRIESLVIRATGAEAALMFVRVPLDVIRKLSKGLSRLP